MNHVSVRCASCNRVTSVPAHRAHVVYYPPQDGEDIARLYYRCSSCHAVEWLTILSIEGRIHCETLGITRFDWSNNQHPAGMALLEHAITVWLTPELRIRTLEIELERILDEAEL